MRAIHLLGLRGVGGARLRFFPTDDAALVIPWWIPERDREVILAFYQQVIADDLLVRVEVEWEEGLSLQDLEFLASERRRHGAEDRMVVVRVRSTGVDLHDVLGLPEIRSFRRVAVVCDQMAANETIGVLLELGRVATLAAEERYDQLAQELSLQADARALLAPVLQRLLNPVDAVESFNTLIQMQTGGVPEAQHQAQVIAHSLKRLFEELPLDESLALLPFVAREHSGAPVEIEGRQRLALRSRMLLRDDRLAGWATWLLEPRFLPLLTLLTESAVARSTGSRTAVDLAAAQASKALRIAADVAKKASSLKPPP